MREDNGNTDTPTSSGPTQGLNSDSETLVSTYIDGSIGGDVVIPNGTLLLDADYSRVGNDLVLDGPDGQSIIVGDYFSQGDAATLINEAGAAIKGNVATQLAGPLAPGQYAQTGTGTLGEVIGELDKVSGDITITGADGTVRSVNTGDPIFEGDVLVTGADGALGIIFADKSTMSMAESGRIVLDEMIYDPAEFSGNQVFDIVQGAFVFTSGIIGKNDPDSVTVNTPVATIGIRGTKYAVDVSDIGGVTTVVLLEGAINVYNNAGQVVVDEIGFYTVIGGLDMLPMMPTSMPASQLEVMMGRAILFHPEQPEIFEHEIRGDKDAENIDNLADQLDDLSTAAGGNDSPPVGITRSVRGSDDADGRGGSGTLSGSDGLPGVGFTSNDPDGRTVDSSVPRAPPTNPFEGTSGNDVIEGDDGDNFLDGQGGNDVLYGTGGNDVVWGGDGDDHIIGGSGEGDDIYDGGAGNDTIYFDSQTQATPVTVNLAEGTATGLGIDTDTLRNIENVFAGHGDDIVVGDVNDNTLVGSDGSDTIRGGDGDDIIKGDSDQDFDPIAELLGQEHDDQSGPTENEKQNGPTFNDDLSGGDGDDTIFGNEGDDTINGDEGSDTIYGGTGDDEIYGGSNQAYDPGQPFIPETEAVEYDPGQPFIPEAEAVEYDPGQPFIPETQAVEYDPGQPFIPETQAVEYDPGQPFIPETQAVEYDPGQPFIPVTDALEYDAGQPFIPETLAVEYDPGQEFIPAVTDVVEYDPGQPYIEPTEAVEYDAGQPFIPETLAVEYDAGQEFIPVTDAVEYDAGQEFIPVTDAVEYDAGQEFIPETLAVDYDAGQEFIPETLAVDYDAGQEFIPETLAVDYDAGQPFIPETLAVEYDAGQPFIAVTEAQDATPEISGQSAQEDYQVVGANNYSANIGDPYFQGNPQHVGTKIGVNTPDTDFDDGNIQQEGGERLTATFDHQATSFTVKVHGLDNNGGRDTTEEQAYWEVTGLDANGSTITRFGVIDPDNLSGGSITIDPVDVVTFTAVTFYAGYDVDNPDGSSPTNVGGADFQISHLTYDAPYIAYAAAQDAVEYDAGQEYIAPTEAVEYDPGQEYIAPTEAVEYDAGQEYIAPTEAVDYDPGQPFIAETLAVAYDAGQPYIAPTDAVVYDPGQPFIPETLAVTYDAGQPFIAPTDAVVYDPGQPFIAETLAVAYDAGQPYVAPTDAVVYDPGQPFVPVTEAVEYDPGQDYIAPTDTVEYDPGQEYIAPTEAVEYSLGQEYIAPTEAVEYSLGQEYIAPTEAVTEILVGGSGSDWIVGGAGDDDLWGFMDHATLVDGIVEAGDGYADGDKDVFFYSTGDGNDIIHDFEVGVDQVVISGDYNTKDVVFSEVSDGNGGFDTIIAVPDGETITLAGISNADLFGDGPASATLYSGADNGVGDGDRGDNTLSGDELVDLRGDLFSDTPNAPDAGSHSIVVVAVMEPGILDTSNEDPPV